MILKAEQNFNKVGVRGGYGKDPPVADVMLLSLHEAHAPANGTFV